jgi:predicted Fe-Mo cluster-binding NifX family protein
VTEANRFLREHHIAEFNRRFQVAPAQRGSAFVASRRRDLDLVFSLQFERTVNRDNTVSFENLQLQIERVKWRATLAGCNITVHQHLDGTISLTHGPHRLGRFSAQGVALSSAKNATPAAAVEKTHPPLRRLRMHKQNQSQKPDISLATKSGHLICYEHIPVSGDVRTHRAQPASVHCSR